jgi:pyruvate,water dikinase
MASHDSLRRHRPTHQAQDLKNAFFSRFDGARLEFAQKLLDLGRASYRLRDDDNIFIGRIERQVYRALNEGYSRIRNRITEASLGDMAEMPQSEIVRGLQDTEYVPKKAIQFVDKQMTESLHARQLVGQPAGPGVGQGRARVVTKPDDLMEFKAGEILVCDALDPTMTFVVPLSEGIVERRGGMLIHGAIIAREYGIACVTGVPDATVFIRTGDTLVVDGYLGVVTIKKSID